MRKREVDNGISVHAIAGSHVVLLGLDTEKPVLENHGTFLGFAIHRTDFTEDEQYFLRGFKTFEKTEPNPWPGSHFSTREHPIQTYMWGDYTAKPSHEYEYKIIPVYGKPTNLEEKGHVSVRVTTEDWEKDKHGVIFNRATSASQAYSRKFGNVHPRNVPDRKAFEWLSRGLEEGMMKFIRKGTGSGKGLRAAVYEFTYVPVLGVFKEVADTGSDISIVYHAKDEKHRKSSEKAMKKAGLDKLPDTKLEARETNPSYLSHNKFIVLLENGAPKSVWTGSTNFTESGIFGHSNVGHVIRDPTVAKRYLSYWNELYGDPTGRKLKKWVELNTPVPTTLSPNSTQVMFSPRSSMKVLEWYAELIDNAQECVCITAPFGLSGPIKEAFDKREDFPRFLLFEGGDEIKFEWDRNRLVAHGSKLQLHEHELARYLREVPRVGKMVKYIHTKYILIDPLGSNPIVITGSANFSENSTLDNDENMLVVHGSKRVADIYLGEFVRLFNHYYFRMVASRQREKSGSTKRMLTYLDTKNEWWKGYFKKGSRKDKQRLLFRGITQTQEEVGA